MDAVGVKGYGVQILEGEGEEGEWNVWIEAYGNSSVVAIPLEFSGISVKSRIDKIT